MRKRCGFTLAQSNAGRSTTPVGASRGHLGELPASRCVNLESQPKIQVASHLVRRPALVAQGIEHSFPKAGVAGSNPAGGISGFADSASFLALAASLFSLQGFLATRCVGLRLLLQHRIFHRFDWKLCRS